LAGNAGRVQGWPHRLGWSDRLLADDAANRDAELLEWECPSKPDRTGIARRRVDEKRPGDAARP